MAKTSIPRSADLLRWYDAHKRDLPWREHAGRAETPYHTWIAEIMLQQTGVVTVIPYYMRFLKRWPTIRKLAAAEEQDVLGEWAGLGYYSRARNLLKCAQAVTKDHGGIFPEDITELKKLPGVGDYTANAIRAIAFDKPANVIDGNVERVVSRIFRFGKALDGPKVKSELKELAASLLPSSRHGDYAQALMDLGATICTPRAPKCGQCPWNKNCAAFAKGDAEKFPIARKRTASPEKHTHAFVIHDAEGNIFLRQRADKGILAGLWEFPSTEWAAEKSKPVTPIHATFAARDSVRHIFTHLKLNIAIHAASLPRTKPDLAIDGKWFSVKKLPPLPTLTRKILDKAASGGVE
jgi:A/G-specific adenine glycosylase